MIQMKRISKHTRLWAPHFAKNRAIDSGDVADKKLYSLYTVNLHTTYALQLCWAHCMNDEVDQKW